MKQSKNASNEKRLQLTKESIRKIAVKTRLHAGEPTTGPGAETYTCGGCSGACA
jgi:hypothetical protein